MEVWEAQVRRKGVLGFQSVRSVKLSHIRPSLGLLVASGALRAFGLPSSSSFSSASSSLSSLTRMHAHADRFHAYTKKIGHPMCYQSEVYKTSEEVVSSPRRTGDLGVGISVSPKER